MAEKKKSTCKTENKQKYPSRWPKGVSGNPNGRPRKEESFTTLIKEYTNKPDKKGSSITRKQKLIEKLYRLAFKNFAALKYLIDRCDGLPKAFHEVENIDKMGAIHDAIESLGKDEDIEE